MGSGAVMIPTGRPYPGLRPFRREESHLFFGRDEQVDRLLERLERCRFIAIVGESGCGKSSLIRAGVIPALETGFMATAGSEWRFAVMRPGGHPLRNLARALFEGGVLGPRRQATAAGDAPSREQHPLPPEAVAFLHADLRRGPHSLAEAIRRAPGRDGESILLLVDQFEEIFRFGEETGRGTRRARECVEGTKAVDRDEADAFVAQLLATVTQAEVPVYVVLTMRSDHLGRCALFPGLPERIDEGQFLTPRLLRDERQAAILGPARVFGGDLEPVLVNRLLNDLGDDPDQLPVLQHALMRLWSVWTPRREAGPIGLRDYERIGWLENALSLHADETLAGLRDDRQRQVAEALFKNLVYTNLDEQKVRNPITLGMFCRIAGVAREEALAVIDAFCAEGRSFLALSSGEDGPTDETFIDLSHESLIRKWKTLSDWADEQALASKVRRQLTENASLWDQRGRDPSYLFRDARLAEAEKIREIEGDALGVPEKDFIAASIAARERETYRKRTEEYRRQRGELSIKLHHQLSEGASAWDREGRAPSHLLRDPRLLAEAAELCEVEGDTLGALERDFFEASIAARSGESERKPDEVSRPRPDEAATPGRRADTQAKVCISFSRPQKQYVLKLHDRLIARGLTVWVDWEGIRPSPDLTAEVRAALESSDAFLFVATPSSLDSAFCRRELEYAVQQGKRIIPITYREPDRGGAPAPLGGLTWLIFREGEDEDDAIELLINRILVDFEWVRFHTRLLVRASEWERRGRTPDLALRGDDLGEAERMAVRAPDYESPRMTRLQQEYVLASRQFAARRLRSVLALLASTLIIALILATLAFVQYDIASQALQQANAAQTDEKTARIMAEKETRRATALRLSSQAQAIVEQHPQRALILAAEAANTERTDEAVGRATENALHGVLGSCGGIALSGHTNAVDAVAFSPDGRRLATASLDNTARLWDLGAADPAAAPVVLRGHTGPVDALAFSPDGEALATASSDGTARLWDVASGKPRASFRGHKGPVIAVAFSPDGKALATASRDGTARLWDLAAADPAAAPVVFRGPEGGVDAVAFSPDGKALAIASRDDTARLWHLVTPAAPPLVLRGREPQVFAVAFSPDGKVLATASIDGTARLWDVASGEPRASFRGHEGPVIAVALSPDGVHLATASIDGTARLWDVRRPDESPLVLRGREAQVYAVVFSPDSKALAIASGDGTARLWDLGAADRATAPVVLRGHEGPVFALKFSPDGRRLATASGDGTARLWDRGAPIADPLVMRIDSIRTVAISPDGRILATASGHGTARLWDVASGSPEPRAIMRGPEGRVIALALAFSPGGKALAIASIDGTARLWDVASGSPEPSATLRGPEALIYTLAFSPDGKILAAGFDDFKRVGGGEVVLWDVSTGSRLGDTPLAMKEGPSASLAFDPRGKVLAAGFRSIGKVERGGVVLWDVASWRRLGEPRVVDEGSVTRLAFRTDGELLAAASNDGTVRLWKLDPAAPPVVLRGGGAIGDLAFSPDGRRLAIASSDGTARLWDLGAADPAAAPVVLRGHEGPVIAVAFRPDDRRLLTVSTDKTARLWRIQLDDLLGVARRTAGRNLSLAEWEQFFPGQPYRSTFPELPGPFVPPSVGGRMSVRPE